MYYYIVDPQKLNQNQFERVQNQLYSSLSSYRINGEVSRSSALRTIPQLVETAFSRGAKTLVAVGSDETLHEVINAIKDRDTVVGFIPLVQSEAGRILGLTDINIAAKTIALRRIELIDLGVVNNYLFLTKLSFGVPLNVSHASWSSFFDFGLIKKIFDLPSFEVKFSADENYSGSLKVISGMIINSRKVESNSSLGNPVDGILDVLLLSKLSKLKMFKYHREILAGRFEEVPDSSLLHLKKIEITSPEGLPLKVDSRVIAKTPATIQILPRALRIIVGKERGF